MRKCIGTKTRNDDEWYTPRETADKLAAWLARHLPASTPLLCPADVLPDGTESTIPAALMMAGFGHVRVTRDLPLDPLLADWHEGEIVVTNPPFSLLVPFRDWLAASGARFCVLARPGCFRRCWSVPEMTSAFYTNDGRGVAAAWHQNITDTSREEPEVAIGNCSQCERRGACPNNAMTGGLVPGEDRPLYGWSHAVRLGLVGWYCHGFTVGGKIAFLRFMADPKKGIASNARLDDTSRQRGKL